jgi:two-component system, NarL family, sensor kinase
MRYYIMDAIIIQETGKRAMLILLLLLVACHIPAYCQKDFADSLKNRIAGEKNTDEKVRMYVQLGNRLQGDTVESWRCHAEILRIAKETENELYVGQANLLAGIIHRAKHPVKSIVDYENAANIFLKYQDNKRAMVNLGASYINLGLIHSDGADYNTAIDYYLKAEDIYLRNDPNHSDVALLYSNLSITYGILNKSGDALVVSKKGLDRARKGNDQVALMNAYYAHGGNLVTARKAGTEGIVLLDSAKQLAVRLNNLFFMYSADLLTAMHYYNTKQYPKAIAYYTKNLDMARKFNSSQDIGNCYLNISACEAELKLAKKASVSLDSAAKYLDLSTITVSKQMFFENSAEVLKQLGNYTKAFAYKDSVGVIKDSLYYADNVRQTQFRQARYNYEKKQNEIVQLEKDKMLQTLAIRQKNILNYVLIGAAITLLVISFLSYRTYRQKQKIQQQRISELETEKQLTATEAVLKGEEQERTRLAKDLHDGLGGMLSGIKYAFNTMKGNLIMTADNNLAFERSMDMLDSSIKELRRVAHNMMPEALVKFGLDTALNDYCNDINQHGALQVSYQSIDVASATIDQTTAITIYRVVQELINNTLKHGAATKIIVQVTKTQQQLAVTVEDDGQGFDTKILRQSKGIGWTNIQHRVEFLKGKVDVNSEPGKGTSVYIELNV